MIKEKNKRQEIGSRTFVLLLSIIIFTAILMAGLVFSSIEIEGNVKCDSGYIGLNITENGNFSLNDIDGLNCEVDYRMKAPLIFVGGLI